MTPFANLVRENVSVLDQGIALLGTLDDASYVRPEPRIASSGVGTHFRHLLDHYDRFLDGIDTGHVDYDARPRDRQTELRRLRAIARLELVRTALLALDPALTGRRLTVRLDAADVDHGDAPHSGSTADRELQSLLSHTVHHYALIAATLRLMGHDPGRTFGVAPSTLRHWQTEAAQETRSCAR
jgi:uncharacterized damage-inducible protein DinB